ncbi:MAG: ketopantoate reductase family protein [Candidatus Eisenbacteria bacterium]
MERSKRETRVGIVGAGALGTLLASCLSRAGIRVRVLLRSSGRAEACRREAPLAEPTDDPAALLPASFVFLCVKSYQTGDAARRIAPSLLETPTPVVSLQNGWGNLDLLEHALPGVPLVAGTTTLGAYWDEAGRVHASTGGITIFTAWTPGAEPDAAAAARLFTGAGLRAEIAANAREVLWRKLVLNVAVNPLTAIHAVVNGAVRDSPALYALACAAAREAVAVGAARGFLHAPYDPEPLLDALLHDTAGNRSSMAEDVARARPTEGDAILGAVRREGDAAGVPTPIATLLSERLAALEAERSARPKP